MNTLKALIVAQALTLCLPALAQARACRDVDIRVRNHSLSDIKVTDIEYEFTWANKNDGKERLINRIVRGGTCEVWNRNLDRAGGEMITLKLKYQTRSGNGWSGKRTVILDWGACENHDVHVYHYTANTGNAVCN